MKMLTRNNILISVFILIVILFIVFDKYVLKDEPVKYDNIIDKSDSIIHLIDENLIKMSDVQQVQEETVKTDDSLKHIVNVQNKEIKKMRKTNEIIKKELELIETEMQIEPNRKQVPRTAIVLDTIFKDTIIYTPVYIDTLD